jgi:hypothetical protein
MHRTLLLFSLIGSVQAAENTVWVSHRFVGGPKCATSGPVIHFTPPGFEAEKIKFKQANLFTYREYFRDNVTCQACRICPNYSRNLLFEILEKDVPRAEKLKYRLADPQPSASEINEFQRSKTYRPPPDIPAEVD